MPTWLLFSSYSHFISNRADEFIIGGVFSTSMIDSYHVGSELAMLLTSEVTLLMIRTLVFTYSKISHVNAKLRKAFCGVFNYVAIL